MILILPVLLGLVPGAIAAAKGKNFFLWWLYGACLFIIALPHALLTRSNIAAVAQRRHNREPTIKCPSCAELVKADARICRHCQRDIVPALTVSA